MDLINGCSLLPDKCHSSYVQVWHAAENDDRDSSTVLRELPYAMVWFLGHHSLGCAQEHVHSRQHTFQSLFWNQRYGPNVISDTTEGGWISAQRARRQALTAASPERKSRPADWFCSLISVQVQRPEEKSKYKHKNSDKKVIKTNSRIFNKEFLLMKS